MTTTKEKIEIYVACLAAYNEGYLHGRWIDATQGVDYVREEIKDMLEKSPVGKEAEEWAIHCDNGFEGYHVEEWHDLEDLCEVAEFIREYEETFDSSVISWLIQDFGIEGARNMISDNYIGEFRDSTEFAYHHVEEIGLLSEVDKTVAMYFDYEAFGRDAELNGDILSVNNHYFWNM